MRWYPISERYRDWKRERDKAWPWHRWFAWYPVVADVELEEGGVVRRTAWLEYVWRSGSAAFYWGEDRNHRDRCVYYRISAECPED